MAEFQAEQIKELKDVFHQAQQNIPYTSLGLQGKLNRFAESKGRVPERLAIIRSALIPQLILMAKTSTEQMLECFESLKYMEFFGKAVLLDGKGFAAEKVISDYITEAFNEMMIADSNAAKGLVNERVGAVNSATRLTPAMISKALDARNALINQLSRLDEVLESQAYLKERQEKKLPLFDVDEKPKLKWGSPSLDFALLQQQGIGSMENIIIQSIDYATTLLAKTQLIQNALIPAQGSLTDKWVQETQADYSKVEKLLTRIDGLSEMREQRIKGLDLKLS